jgi:PAS domain S-box-containing protein
MERLTAEASAELFDAAPIALLTVDASGLIVLGNSQAESLFGYSHLDLIGRDLSGLIDLSDPVSTSRTMWIEATGHRRDGATFSAAASISTASTEFGILTTAAIVDVSERVAVTAEADRVRTEAERVRLVVEVERVKAQGEKIVAEGARVKAEDEKIVAEGARVKAEDEKIVAEGARVKAEDEKIVAEGARVKAEDEKSVAEDVRLQAVVDRGHLEAQLHQSQRMESLGELAGGVAHDFNNLLAVILNYASFVAEELLTASVAPGGTKWEGPLKDVEQIQLAAERASLLTRQLLAFARREVVHAQALSLNDAIGSMEQILRRTIGAQIDLAINLADDLPMIIADPGQVEQVILNLVINARDAMPSGGTLSIDTSTRSMDDEDLSSDPLQVFVCCRVSDNGIGMTPQVRDRAYEPFFTTKPTGEGSGLGLATVYGIVSQSGGRTKIYSDLGVGTSVTILLPAASPEATRGLTLTNVADSPQVGTETILVVDDESALREVTRRILVRSGYTVLSASGGREAIDLATASPKGSIDLVLTDMIMPAMQGPTVAVEIRKIHPNIRVLFMSGHAQPALKAGSMLGTDFDLIEKPFDQVTLLKNVRRVLDQDE